MSWWESDEPEPEIPLDAEDAALDAQAAKAAEERAAAASARSEAFLALRCEARRRGLPFYAGPGAALFWAALSDSSDLSRDSRSFK